VKDTFSVFNVNVTDVDPGSADHFEIMVAGTSTQLGLSANTYGVSPFNCNSAYLPDALVFDFANQFIANPGAFGNNAVEEEICATAAQEIAHAFTLDHVSVASDPMTYFEYVGRRVYTNGPAQCGSDCVNGRGPFGQTCTGNNHACACTGQQMQDSVATLTSLFGAGPGSPPTVTITNPRTGDNVSPGFPVGAVVMDNSPAAIEKVELRIDSTLIDTQTRGPFAFNTPATLGDGTHRIEVTGYDAQGTPGKAAVEVVIGPPCTKPSDCSNNTDTCIGGRCVPGPGVQGGLGMTCTNGADCASGQCGSDGTNMYCVEQCTKGQCPGGFGCLIDTGMTTGVCWPGADDGSGGCSTTSRAPGGAVASGLLFALLVFARRRRRS
jgi:Bacterial Ig domain